MSSKMTYEKIKDMFETNQFPINISSDGGWYGMYKNNDTVDLVKGNLVQIDMSTNSVIRTIESSSSPYVDYGKLGVVLDNTIPVGTVGKIVFQGFVKAKTSGSLPTDWKVCRSGSVLGEVSGMGDYNPYNNRFVGYPVDAFDNVTKLQKIYIPPK